MTAFREAMKLTDLWLARFALGVAYVRAGHYAKGSLSLRPARSAKVEASIDLPRRRSDSSDIWRRSRIGVRAPQKIDRRCRPPPPTTSNTSRSEKPPSAIRWWRMRFGG